jgi:hypothetical protein
LLSELSLASGGAIIQISKSKVVYGKDGNSGPHVRFQDHEAKKTTLKEKKNSDLEIWNHHI